MSDPLGTQLQNIANQLKEHAAVRRHAKEKGSMKKMRECSDPILRSCQSFKAVWNPAYIPESERLEPTFQALADARDIATVDECLSRLQSEIEWVQQHRSTFQ